MSGDNVYWPTFSRTKKLTLRLEHFYLQTEFETSVSAVSDISASNERCGGRIVASDRTLSGTLCLIDK